MVFKNEMLTSQQTHGVQPVNHVRETTAVCRERHTECVSAMWEKREVLKLAVCSTCSRLRLKCDGTPAETRFRLSAKWTSPFK